MNCAPLKSDVGIANSQGRMQGEARGSWLPYGCMIVHNNIKVAILSAEYNGKPLDSRGSVPIPVEGAHSALSDPLTGEEGLLPPPKTVPTPLSAFSPSVLAPNEKNWARPCQQSDLWLPELIFFCKATTSRFTAKLIIVCCDRLLLAHSANFIKLTFMVVKIFC